MDCLTRARQGTSLGLSILLILTIGPGDVTSMAYQSTTSSYPGQGVPATADELQSVVAPIALYPDSLVAQILSAATFPDQVANADYWLQQNKSLTGSALMTAVNNQTWDPSVKALTQFPSVLHNMAQNLAWTSQLGEDYHNQQADVMAAIQALRAKAKAAGNLNSGPQITVVQQSPQTIVIQPTNPQIVYVPQYNPTVIYGTPYVVPGYSTGDLVAASVLSFGVGMAVGAMMSGGCCGWGYSSWNCNWYGGAAVYHGGAYTGTPPGAATAMAPAAAPMVPTVVRTMAPVITPPPAPMPAARRLNCLRHAKGRAGVQPLHRRLQCRACQRFQRLLQSGQFDVLKEQAKLLDAQHYSRC